MQLESNLQAIQDIVAVSKQRNIFFLLGYPGSCCRPIAKALTRHPAISCVTHGHFADVLEPELFKSFARYNAEIPKQGNWSRHRKEGTAPITPEMFTYNRNEMAELVTEAIHVLFSRAVKDKDTDYIGDYTPENIQRISLLSQLFPHARFLHVVRDVRDIATRSWLDEPETKPDITAYAENIAKSWFRELTKARAVAKQIDDRYLEIQYEQVWNKPNETFQQILAFLAHDGTTRFTEGRLDSFSQLDLDRQNTSAPGVWKDHLDLVAQDRIKASCGRLMAQLGYI